MLMKEDDDDDVGRTLQSRTVPNAIAASYRQLVVDVVFDHKTAKAKECNLFAVGYLKLTFNCIQNCRCRVGCAHR
jgi:hypothetical protein